MSSEPTFVGLKNIEYLNLEISNNFSKLSINQNIIGCHFNKHSPHILHGNNPILNSMIDLQISLSISLKYHNDKLFRILENFNKNLIDIKNLIINSNLEYIKNQNNDILKNLKHDQLQIEKLAMCLKPKQDSKQILQKTDDKLKEVEKLLLDIKKIILS